MLKISLAAFLFIFPSEVHAGDTALLKSYNIKVLQGNVREKPSRTASIIDRVSNGEKVTLIERADKWFFAILPNGKTGWIHKSLFRDEKDDGSQRHKNPQTRLLRLETVIVTNREERILFTLSDFVTPRVFTIEGRRPMVVCDFMGVGPGPEVEESNKIDGRIIKSVNVLVHSVEEPITRIIIELFSKQDYDMQHVFYKEENLYVLNIKQM